MSGGQLVQPPGHFVHPLNDLSGQVVHKGWPAKVAIVDMELTIMFFIDISQVFDFLPWSSWPLEFFSGITPRAKLTTI
jgi:hypothetical protein